MGVRIWHDLLRFRLLHSRRRSSSDTNCLTEADSFQSARRAAIPPRLVRPRPVLPPGTGRPSSGPLGDVAGSGGYGAFESTSVRRPVVEHKTDGHLSFVMEAMSPTNKSG